MDLTEAVQAKVSSDWMEGILQSNVNLSFICSNSNSWLLEGFFA